MASALNNQQCDLCRKRHVAKNASLWCFECNEFLCSDCSANHQVQNVTKNHKPIQMADYFKLKPNITSIQNNCDKHGFTFDCYCAVHDTPICVKCVTEVHKTCTIKPLTEITENIKESFLFTDLKERASDFHDVVQQVIEDVSSQQEKIERETNKAISTVETARKEINRHLDHLQGEIIKKIRTTAFDQRDNINRILTTLQEFYSDALQTLESITLADSHASNIHTYCGIKIWNDEIQQLERKLLSLQNNLQYSEHLGVEVNLKLRAIHTDIKEFASLKIKQTKPSIKLLAKERQGQKLVTNPTGKTDITLSKARSFTLPVGKKSLNVNGCCIMEPGNMILTDFNQRLITVDKTGKLCKDINLSFSPFDVVEVDDHTVGVTSGRGEKLVLVDINKGKVIRTVYEGERCWGLCYTDGKFIVSVPNKVIKVIGLDGKVLSTIHTVDDATAFCVNNNILYYAAYGTDSVYCCDMARKVKWKYKCDKGDGPIGITVDNKENVLVTCYYGDKLIAIDKTGKESKVLLTEKDGMCIPRAITYSKKHNILLVTNECDGKCFVYDTK